MNLNERSSTIIGDKNVIDSNKDYLEMKEVSEKENLNENFMDNIHDSSFTKNPSINNITENIHLISNNHFSNERFSFANEEMFIIKNNTDDRKGKNEFRNNNFMKTSGITFFE